MGAAPQEAGPPDGRQVAVVMHDVKVGHGAVALLLAGLALHLLQGDPLGEGVNAQDLGGLQRQGREGGEEKLHGRPWKEGRQSRGSPGGYIPMKGWVHEYGTVSPAAPWLSTWRGTALVRRAWGGATRIRQMLGRQGQKRKVEPSFSFPSLHLKMKKKAPSWSVACFSKLIRKPQGSCHLGT